MSSVYRLAEKVFIFLLPLRGLNYKDIKGKHGWGNIVFYKRLYLRTLRPNLADGGHLPSATISESRRMFQDKDKNSAVFTRAQNKEIQGTCLP